MSDARKQLGSQGEQVAERYLHKLGYRILERNLRTALGEMDLVAMQGDTLVFCEVKSRQGVGELFPGDAIHHRKQQRLIRLATAYLQRHPGYEASPCRFDAVLVWKTGPCWRVELITDAFRPGW
ncbi:MAG: YraN family protein [Magnetococcales bacterium]|nr:YraN family protein [Magnetococcales bacterium]MBF0583795.1 YraN family protein [Magnetococcales bacterium]